MEKNENNQGQIAKSGGQDELPQNSVRSSEIGIRKKYYSKSNHRKINEVESSKENIKDKKNVYIT